MFCLAKLSLEAVEDEIVTIGFIAIIELFFPLWLVVRGVNAEVWEQRVKEGGGW